MVRGPGLGALLAFGLIAGCGRSATGSDATQSASSLPPVSLQVHRAQTIGPGFLDYCPRKAGRAVAHYQIDVPGNPLAGGWCQTSIVRKPDGDTITFRAYWDARASIGRTGTMIFRYFIPRRTKTTATPAPVLVSQSGVEPP